MNEIVTIPIGRLHPHENNPRRELGDLTDLANSLRSMGVMQNLTVVRMPDSVEKFGEEHYTVVAGHRRLAAAKEAGLESLPCVIAELTPLEQQGMMMAENMQRENLSPVEQAWGFQMMLNLGDDVAGIAQRTGVSKRRVKTRLEIGKLDQKKLAKAMKERQISIGELDKLAKIDDVAQRNSLLGQIGTYNFEWQYNRILTAQEAEKALPECKAALKRLKAKKIADNDKYSGKYTDFNRLKITDGAKALEEAAGKTKKPLFYWLGVDVDEIRLYVERSNEPTKKRDPAEIEEEKQKKQTKEELQRLQKEFFELRAAFAAQQTVTPDNRETWIKAAIAGLVYGTLGYARGYTQMKAALGLAPDKTAYAFEGMKILREKQETIWPAVIYAYYDDGEEQGYFTGYSYQWPRYKKNDKLDEIYALLEALGYHLADEEQALRDGTHPLLHRGEEAEA